MSFSEWREYKIKDVSTIVFSGGTPSTQKKKYWDGEFNWLSSGETRNRFIIETEKKITQEGVENSSTKLANKEDILIASAGQGNTRGQTSFCKIDTYINQSIIAIRSNKNLVSPYFLFYNIIGRYNELRQISDGHSIRGSLTTKLINQLKVTIPPLERQKVIAKTLYDLDSKIEINNKINKKLEEMIESIFKQWFIDFEFPNEYGKPYKTSKGRMITTTRGEIPDGWEINTMQKAIKFSNGKKKPIEIGNIPIYGGNGVLGYTNKSNSENVIVVGRVGAYCGSIYLEPNKCWVSDNGISGTSLLDDVYYAYQLLKTYNLNSMHIGSSQPLLTQCILNNIEIVLPSIEVVKKYNNFVRKLYKKIFNINNENKTLSNIRDVLLPKLMNGEIEFDNLNLETW